MHTARVPSIKQPRLSSNGRGDSSYKLRVVGPTIWPLAYCKYSFFTLKLVELIIALNGSKRTELNKNCTIIFSYFSAVFGNWTTRGYANSRIANSRTGQLAVLQMPPKERKLSTQLAVASASCPVTQFLSYKIHVYWISLKTVWALHVNYRSITRSPRFPFLPRISYREHPRVSASTLCSNGICRPNWRIITAGFVMIAYRVSD